MSLARLTDSQIKNFNLVFDQLDADHDNKIAVCDQLFEFLDRVGLQSFYDPDYLLHLLKVMDIKDDYVTKNDAINICRAILGKKQKTQSNMNILNIGNAIAQKITNLIDGDDAQDYAPPQALFQEVRRVPPAKVSQNAVSPETGVLINMEEVEEEDYEYYSYSEEEAETIDHGQIQKTVPLFDEIPEEFLAEHIQAEEHNERQKRAQVQSNSKKYTHRSPSGEPSPSSPVEKDNLLKGNVPNKSVSNAKMYQSMGRRAANNKQRTQPTKRKKHALQDPKVRKQLQNRKAYKPYFFYLVIFVEIGLLLYGCYLNYLSSGKFVADFSVNPFIGPTGSILISLGAKYNPCMRNESLPYKREAPCSPNYPQNDVTYPKLNNGNCTVLYNLQYLCQMSGFSEDYPDQLWRFASAMFLHSGIIHLLLIILLQKYKGLKMEEQIGYLRMGVIYITCGISGNLLSSIIAPKNITVGGSGAMYGLFGLLLLDIVQNWPILTTPWRDLIKLTISLLIALGIGLLPYIDNYAHFGGFFAGIFSGLIFMPKLYFSKADRRKKILFAILSVPILLGLLGVGFYLFFQNVAVNCPWCTYVDCIPPNAIWCQSD